MKMVLLDGLENLKMFLKQWRKQQRDAKKNLVKIPLNGSISSTRTKGKFGTCSNSALMVQVIAGGAVRSVLESKNS
jgi:ribosomal protein S5